VDTKFRNKKLLLYFAKWSMVNLGRQDPGHAPNQSEQDKKVQKKVNCGELDLGHASNQIGKHTQRATDTKLHLVAHKIRSNNEN
jgi:hypothetical protein